MTRNGMYCPAVAVYDTRTKPYKESVIRYCCGFWNGDCVEVDDEEKLVVVAYDVLLEVIERIVDVGTDDALLEVEANKYVEELTDVKILLLGDAAGEEEEAVVADGPAALLEELKTIVEDLPLLLDAEEEGI
ncbi:hypothetical protein M406DRAFT_328093 [Cryphonectria parasitica EP155]|uniref:Uncharacterized protein n=1 Tax=Cryphonectria parasitica (strain ATCC 38755 / EP155) TaxID=660469 RepID=A0A9P5CQZ0_CRYP1|nr:uncharacterized protein M406DRAFT_328093 [Cryphonectria parasitica EP155]KAF3766982.1 hypothetical protein M406DRAFT_328093 [Cryphonectria parasitica EP155]